MILKFIKSNTWFVLILLATVFAAGAAQTVLGQKVRLRSKITPACNSTSNAKYSDIYADGNIAVQGGYFCNGVFIYDLTNPDSPVLASWYNPPGNIQFLEAIVVGNRGYFGSGNGFGVHIVDLTNPYSPTLLGTVDATRGNGFSRIHEMVVWGNFLIENYNSTSFSKVLKFINIADPANPVFIRDLNPSEVQWIHAMHVRGNRMYTSGWGNSTNRARTEIYDISNITTQAPTLLGFVEDTTGITAGNRMHSAWTSEDGNFLYSARETNVGDGDVRVYNITNPAQPLLVNRIGMNDLGLNAVTPHNPVVKGNYLYVAWYQAGLQVFDISDPANPKRLGQYDTYQPAFAPSEEEKARALTADPEDLVCGNLNLVNLLPTSYDGNWAVFPFLGEDKVLLGDLDGGLYIVDVTKINQSPKNQISDFDGDGKTDLSAFSPSTGDWLVEKSADNSSSTVHFGSNGDRIVAGDYDGDGKSDTAVFRPNGGIWYILASQNGFSAHQFGANGDIPVPADYDADGITDLAVWRPSSGVWYILQSKLGLRIVKWGLNGDKPFAGDYEGDGKADLAIYRPGEGIWYVLKSSSTLPLITRFGISTDKPVSADFDGDGTYDFAVFRPSEGNWYILNSRTNSLTIYRFGLAGDVPIPSDFDGDGLADIAVYRPSERNWYRLNSSNGAFSARSFGQTGDLPSPGSVHPQ